MPRITQSTEYFVVGGPVQPDRSCYVERNADEALLASIVDQQFTYILSARASGKSSLMARAIRRLRHEGQLAAVVDLTQIGSRGDHVDAGRWYYSIAYRILRELRLKVDLQTWWQDKSALFSEQRLVEFFWEIILANTTEPVTVFFDEIERAVDLPFAEELFSALRTCYARRVSEPDFTRLNFVVLGVASPSELCPDPGLSPFVDGREIELEDFSLEQCFELSPGLELDEEAARDVLERIFDWTHGQPYLTQKIARAVARKGRRLGDVERVVQEQFVAPGVSQEEPLLSHIRTQLTEEPAGRSALVPLARLAKGVTLRAERGSAAMDRLRLAGVTRVDDDGIVRYRNRIYEQVFDRRWTGQVTPIDWRRPLTAAAVVGAIVMLPLWYTQVLPRPYISTLSVVTQDFAVAEDAYRKLRRLPGFAGTADRLLSEAMLRRSQQAQRLDEVLAADAVLRTLPGRAQLADEVLADYWLGRAESAMSEERRDAALVLAMQAMPGRPERARALAGELIGPDYPRLVASHRLSEPPVDWAVDWSRGRVIVVDAAHRVEERGFEYAALARARSVPVGRLTALQHLPVVRTIDVAEAGSAGAFDLTLDIEHPRAGDLQLTLTAPDGSAVTFSPSESDLASMPWRLTASTGTRLAPLASAPRQGLWRLSIVDRRPEEGGALSSWQLRFAAAGEVWQDAPEQGVALPDPVRTDEVDVDLSADGSVALAHSARAGALGALAVWDLPSGRLRADLQLSEAPERVLFDQNRARALVVTRNALTIWDIENETPMARLETETDFVLPPVTSPEGDYVVAAERTEFAAPLFSLLRVADGGLEAAVAGAAQVRDWALGPDASYLALLVDNGQVRFVDPRSGRELGSLRHHRDIERIVATPNGEHLVTIDVGGDIHVWPLALERGGAAVFAGVELGRTLDPDSVDIDADRIAFAAPDGHAIVRSLNGQSAASVFRLDARIRAPQTRLAPDGRRLVTVNGSSVRLWDVSGEAPAVDAGSGDVSALAVDEDGFVVALGFAGGHVRVRNADQFGRTEMQSYSVDFIGHRGAVSSLAVNAGRNLIASGGEDGVVRAWDLVSVSPSEHFLRHPAGPVRAVAISPDGRWVASAAEYSARVWQVRDGTLLGEIPVNGAATALAFSSGGESLAVGDVAGNVFYGAPRGSDPWRSVRMPSTVVATAFEPQSRWIATGDDTGRVQVWDGQSAQPMGEPWQFEHPVTWLAFSGDGLYLAARSGHWVHRLRVDETGLSVTQSRFVSPGLDSDAVLTSPDASSIRIVGGHATGQPDVLDVALGVAGIAPGQVEPGQFQRDWPTVLGLEIDLSTGLVRNSP